MNFCSKDTAISYEKYDYNDNDDHTLDDHQKQSSSGYPKTCILYRKCRFRDIHKIIVFHDHHEYDHQYHCNPHFDV